MVKFKRPTKASLNFQVLVWMLMIPTYLIVGLFALKQSWTSMVPIAIINTLLNCLLVNSNVYFLIPNLFDTGRKLIYILLSMVLIILITIFKSGALILFDFPALSGAIIRGTVPTLTLLSSVLFFFLSLPLLSIDRQIENERQAAKLKVQALESEIRFLKTQLKPHFLFNVLNNIYSLIYTGSDQAGPTLLKLSRLMQYILYETSGDQVLLRQEVEYLKQLIELQVMKHSDHSVVQFEVSEIPEEIKIPPLLLVPFFENAFKHGNWDSNNGWIKGHLSVSHDQLSFDLTNTKPSVLREYVYGGIGVANIKQRLELLYPKQHKITVEDADDIYKVSLLIDLKSKIQ